MSRPATILRPNTRVLVDGRDKATIWEALPEGSPAWSVPHYAVALDGSSGPPIRVAMSRVSEIVPAPDPEFDPLWDEAREPEEGEDLLAILEKNDGAIWYHLGSRRALVVDSLAQRRVPTVFFDRLLVGGFIRRDSKLTAGADIYVLRRAS